MDNRIDSYAKLEQVTLIGFTFEQIKERLPVAINPEEVRYLMEVIKLKQTKLGKILYE